MITHYYQSFSSTSKWRMVQGLDYWNGIWRRDVPTHEASIHLLKTPEDSWRLATFRKVSRGLSGSLEKSPWPSMCVCFIVQSLRCFQTFWNSLYPFKSFQYCLKSLSGCSNGDTHSHLTKEYSKPPGITFHYDANTRGFSMLLLLKAHLLLRETFVDLHASFKVSHVNHCNLRLVGKSLVRDNFSRFPHTTHFQIYTFQKSSHKGYSKFRNINHSLITTTFGVSLDIVFSESPYLQSIPSFLCVDTIFNHSSITVRILFKFEL